MKVLFDWYLNLLKNKAQNKLIILKPEGILIKKMNRDVRDVG